MSERFPGGFVTMTPPTVSKTSAPGVWTVDQALTNQQAGVWPYGGPFNYIEDVFSAYTYTGNNSGQTITNGVDLSGQGGMVWLKDRTAARPNLIYDTVRGVYKSLRTDDFGAQQSFSTTLTAFNSNGFAVGSDNWVNTGSESYASWTFRKQPKFFDVVTYTGNGNSLNVSHALTSVPGCVMIKRVDSTSDWVVAHRGSGSYWASSTLRLNTTAAGVTNGEFNQLTDTYVRVVNSGASYGDVNTNGATYVMYLFAHDAGGFGPFGTDNVISCGSYTGNGSTSGPTINLGWEPQFVLVKRTDSGGDWYVMDTMRGLTARAATNTLYPNLSNAESGPYDYITINSTGFQATTTYGQINGSGGTFIYIAIRRGPMKTPTTGTQVYKGVARNGAGTSPWVASGAGFPPDLSLMSARDTGNAANNTSYHNSIIDRVRRATEHIQSVNLNAEGGGWGQGHIHNMDGYDGLYSSDASYWATAGQRYVDQHFRRAPGFLDIVYYTGTGSARTVTHGLTVAPELMIVKARNAAEHWAVYCSALTGPKYRLYLNGNYAEADQFVVWNGTAPTSSVFSVGTATDTNNSGTNYIAYLFASLPGVSKIGSYTGTGSPLTVNCGFTSGARFVLIKRKDSTGDWWFFDTARGMVAGNSKALWLNIGGTAEASGGYVYTTSVGFVVESSISDLNASGGSYIYFAIA